MCDANAAVHVLLWYYVYHHSMLVRSAQAMLMRPVSPQVVNMLMNCLSEANRLVWVDLPDAAVQINESSGS